MPEPPRYVENTRDEPVEFIFATNTVVTVEPEAFVDCAGFASGWG